MSDRYEKAIDKIFKLQFFGIKLGLENIRRFLDDLGNPQESFQAILVAGTNGKGSVASTLASICNRSGIKTGLFTSPHLIRFNERFAVNETQITDDQVLELADVIWKKVDARHMAEDPDGPVPITFFEFATAMACLHFKNEGCKLGIFECGLGGRLDATNALEPILDILTPISYDHQQFLGDTLTSIATEKAGILRSCVPVVTAKQDPEAATALFAKFQQHESPSFVAERDFGIRKNGDRAVYWDKRGELSPVKTSLPGAYQLGNTTLAIAAARVLQQIGLPVTDEAILEGPKHVVWPGRLETVAHNPTVIIDGAHNLAAAQLLGKTLKEEAIAGKTVAVISVMGDKDVRPIVEAFAPSFEHVVATQAKIHRAMPAEDLAKIMTQYVSKVEAEPDVETAIEKAKTIAGSDGRVVICGSLFLVGESRAIILGEKGQGPGGKWVGVSG